MLRQTIRHALMATVLTALVVIPIFGLHLERAGVRTIIQPQWSFVLWACALVFVAQLLRPWLARTGRRFNRVCGGFFVAFGALLPIR